MDDAPAQTLGFFAQLRNEFRLNASVMREEPLLVMNFVLFALGCVAELTVGPALSHIVFLLLSFNAVLSIARGFLRNAKRAQETQEAQD